MLLVLVLLLLLLLLLVLVLVLVLLVHTIQSSFMGCILTTHTIHTIHTTPYTIHHTVFLDGMYPHHTLLDRFGEGRSGDARP